MTTNHQEERPMRMAFVTAIVALIAFNAQAQNLFVADWYAGNIYEFTPGGVRSTFATGVPDVVGVAFDSTGNLYATAGGTSGVVYKYAPNGVRSTFATGLDYPRGLAFDSAGNLFVGDNSGNIYKFTPDGVRSTFANVITPYALAFNSAGNLLVTDYNGYKIWQITPSGALSAFFDTGARTPGGLAIDSAGNAFVGTFEGSSFTSIVEIRPDGTNTTFAFGMHYPDGLAFNGSGYLFEADYGTGSINEFTPTGVQSTFASGLQDPIGLAFQPIPEPPALALAGLGGSAAAAFP